jgi:hypothetical protein
LSCLRHVVSNHLSAVNKPAEKSIETRPVNKTPVAVPTSPSAAAVLNPPHSGLEAQIKATVTIRSTDKFRQSVTADLSPQLYRWIYSHNPRSPSSSFCLL